MKKIYLLLVFSAVGWTVPAQDYSFLDKHLDPLPGEHKHYLNIGAAFSYGINIPSNDFVAEEVFNRNRFAAGDIRLSNQTTGRNIYEVLYRYPRFGGGFFAADLFNDTVLGAPNAVYAYMEVPFNKYDPARRWNFYYMISAGLSFNFRPGNQPDNALNVVIGSRNNVYIDLGFYSEYLINPSLDLKMGVSFFHFSNGANQLPNLGINMVGIRTILSHHLTRTDPERRNPWKGKIPAWERRHQFFIMQAIGSKQWEAHGGDYINTTTSLGYKFWYSMAGRIVASADLFYDSGANSGEGATMDIPEENRDDLSNQFMMGVFLGHEAIYKRWSFLAGWGVYAWRNYANGKNSNYQRIGARYRLVDGMFVGVALKAQTFAADYVEWSVGYNF